MGFATTCTKTKVLFETLTEEIVAVAGSKKPSLKIKMNQTTIQVPACLAHHISVARDKMHSFATKKLLAI